MSESKTVTVWTLFHGDQLRKRECPMDEIGSVDLSGLVGRKGRAASYADLESRLAKQTVTFNHLFLFEGLLPWGMGAGVRVCPLLIPGFSSNQGKVPIEFSVPLSAAKTVASNDFMPIGGASFRGAHEENMIQTAFLQLIAVPKKEYRLVVLTFKDRSLAPWWRLVRSSRTELVIETANTF